MEILVAALFLGLIPAAIASSKGRSFGLWYLYGVALFIVALIHSLVLQRGVPALRVDSITAGSAAERAGLACGDVIFECNGMRTSSISDVLSPARGRELKIIRGGKFITLTSGAGSLGVALSSDYVSEQTLALLNLGGASAVAAQTVPPPSANPDPYAALQKIKELHVQGILTDQEYEAKRASLVSQL